MLNLPVGDFGELETYAIRKEELERENVMLRKLGEELRKSAEMIGCVQSADDWRRAERRIKAWDDFLANTAYRNMTPSKEYPDYSEKEIQMFKALGLEDKIQFFADNPVQLYHLAVEHCFLNNLKGVEILFLNNLKGVAVDSLRRCVIALNKCKVYRGTQEWDDLIELNPVVMLDSIWIHRETREKWKVQYKGDTFIFLYKISNPRDGHDESYTTIFNNFIRE